MRGHDGVRLPVQTVDYIPDGVNQVLVLLRAGQNDVVKPLHVGVDGLQGGRLSAPCRIKARIVNL